MRARATQATTNYGIRASASGGTANWAGWFEDDVWVQGDIHLVNGTIVISDQNLKTNITDLTDGLSRVLQLAPKSYQFLTADYPMMELSPDPQMDCSRKRFNR
ncbi:MAG: tail fiber domain-containing protein [Flavobacteriales bacterium]|nr:tail fiber domain-containing protein [Flavobacteriales bacterium]